MEREFPGGRVEDVIPVGTIVMLLEDENTVISQFDPVKQCKNGVCTLCNEKTCTHDRLCFRRHLLVHNAQLDMKYVICEKDVRAATKEEVDILTKQVSTTNNSSS